MALRLVTKNGANMKVNIPESNIGEEKSKNDDTITTLRNLSTDKTSWTIKVRVTKKQAPKPCKSGTGRMQKIDLLDQESTEMSMLLFEDAVVAVGESIIEGEIYYIINGKVKETAVQWRKDKELMIFADKRTKVQHAVDDDTIVTFGVAIDMAQKSGTYTQTMTFTAVTNFVPPPPMKWKQIAAGSDHTCAIASNDQAYCWGYNLYGQIGDNTSGTNRLVPTAVVNP